MARNTVIVSVLADTKKFSKGMKGADTALGKLANVGKAALKTVAGIGVALAGLAVAGGFARALNIDTAQTKLKALGYSAGEVTGIMDSALASVKGTAFGLDSAATVAAQALASGVKEGDALTSALTTVANTAALAGTGMDEMGSIFGKVWANGKVTTQEMNQLADRGVPIWQYLGESFGVSNEELRKMIENGEVTADMFTGALGPAVDGMATTMGGSFKGMLANAGAALSRLGAMFAAPLLGASKGALGGITEAIDALSDKLKPAADAFGEFLDGIDFGALISQVGEFFSAAAPIANVASFFSPIGVALKVLEPLLPPLMDAFSELATTLGGALSGILPVLADLFQQVAVALVPVLAPVLELATVMASALVPVIEAVVPIITMLADLFVRLLPAITPIISAVAALLTPILSLITPLLSLVEAVLPPLVAAFEAVLGIIMPVVQALLDGLVPVVEGVVLALTGLIEFLTGVFTGNWEQAWNGIKTFFEGLWNSIVAVLGAVWNTIVAVVTTAVDNIVRTIQSWGAGILSAVNGAWAGAMAFFRGLPGKIGAFVAGAGRWLLSAGRDLVRGLGEGILAMGQWVLDQIGGVIDGAIGFAKNLLGIQSPSRVFRDIGTNVGKGLADGITGMASKVKSAAGDLADATVGGFGTPELELANSVRLSGGGAGGSGRVINVNLSALNANHETGRMIVEAISEYDRIGGSR